MKQACKREFVYLIRFHDTDFIKIGRTSRSVEQRLHDLSTANPLTLSIVYVIETTNSAELEKYLHKRFRRSHWKLEWFRLSAAQIELIKNEFLQGVCYEWTK